MSYIKNAIVRDFLITCVLLKLKTNYKIKGLKMEYIIKQTIEVITTVIADDATQALKMLDDLNIDDSDQITIINTEIESIEEYEESLK
jgi:hypothetical protein